MKNPGILAPRHLLEDALLLTFILFIGCGKALSQNNLPVIFGKVIAADFNLPRSNVVDSSTNAVIIADVGSIEFKGNKNNWVSYVLKKNTRIKILNKKGYELATEKIQIYGKDDRQDQFDDFHASTYNVENGKVVETKLDNHDLLTQKINKNVNEIRFTMAGVKEGSIIEYSYTITSYHYYYLPGWHFQNLHYPSLYSEFKIGIPDFLRYLTLHYGIDSFYSNKSYDDQNYINMEYVRINTTVHNRTWIMKDIPSFKYEDYINEPKDYLDRLDFSLVQTYDGRDLKNRKTDWKSAEEELLTSRAFGTLIDVENTVNLQNTVAKICSPDGDIMKAAKQIYSYVRDNFTCVPDDDIYAGNDMYDVNKLHKGTVAELNMLLIALLRQRGVRADPVILSTKEYGMHPVTYPILEKMNYVICIMRIGRDSVYLDASDPLLGFGKLPLACYNGHAQIIDAQRGGPVYFYSNNIKEQNKEYLSIVNDENGSGVSGYFESLPGYFGSLELRKTIKEKGYDEYRRTIKLNYPSDVEITNLQIDSLKQLEEPVKIKYDINFKAGDETGIIYFNPFLSNAYKKNPLKQAERKYPVEMPYPVDDTYELSMEIPKGYKVDELPKSVKLSFNGTDGFFEYTIQKDEFLVLLRSHVKLNMAIFAPEDYNSLRDFFAYVVKKQSEPIVFKKK